MLWVNQESWYRVLNMFASDLDRTLIYSKRALAAFNQTAFSNLCCVERKDGEEVAFMTKKARELLQAISKHCLFVPVTTRTYEQFSRIFLFSSDVPLTYAVTSNGANIYYKGERVLEWQEIVRNRLEKECLPIEKMISLVQKLNIIGKLKLAEGLFFYYILKEGISFETINIVRLLAREHGWRVSIQGRKLYFVPKPVCKGEAIKFIRKKQQIQTLFGAGDSILDDDFLKLCDFSYVPSHGELGKDIKLENSYKLSKKTGVLAGEEILDNIGKTMQVFVNNH